MQKRAVKNKTKVAVVLGAAMPGIGQAVTKLLISKKYSVFGTFQEEDSKEAEKIRKMYKGLKMVKVDFSSKKDRVEFVRKLSGQYIDLLVNIQMFFEMENPDNFSHKLWEKSVMVNLSTPNYLLYELKNKIVDGGGIVFVTAAEGFVGSFGASAYNATKAAMHNLVKTYANNFGKRKIRVNAVAPGWIEGYADEIFRLSCSITPLKRLGKPKEVAEVVYFVASKKASYINGQVIVVDGGYYGVDAIAKAEFEEERKKLGRSKLKDMMNR